MPIDKQKRKAEKGMPTDNQERPLYVNSGFVTSDASETPKHSPLTTSDIDTELVMPDFATQISLDGDEDILIKEKDGLGYDRVQSKELIDIRQMEEIVVKSASPIYFKIYIV